MSITVSGTLEGLGMEHGLTTCDITIKRKGGGPDITITGLTKDEGHTLKALFGDGVKLTVEAR